MWPLPPVFNVGKSTALEAGQDVVNVLYDKRDEYIKFPYTLSKTVDCMATFQETGSELPNVSRYQQHMIVQGVVDGTGRFIEADAGFPSSSHDSRVFRNSSLYQEA